MEKKENDKIRVEALMNGHLEELEDGLVLIKLMLKWFLKLDFNDFPRFKNLVDLKDERPPRFAMKN